MATLKAGFVLLALAVLALPSCQRTADAPTPGSPLAGAWRLASRQVMVPNPLPDEILVFDNDQHFSLYRSGQLAALGTYRLGRAPACGTTVDRDQLYFTATGPSGYVPSGAYTVQGNTLVIDQSNRCVSDTGVYTYVHL